MDPVSRGCQWFVVPVGRSHVRSFRPTSVSSSVFLPPRVCPSVVHDDLVSLLRREVSSNGAVTYGIRSRRIPTRLLFLVHRSSGLPVVVPPNPMCVPPTLRHPSLLDPTYSWWVRIRGPWWLRSRRLLSRCLRPLSTRDVLISSRPFRTRTCVYFSPSF